MDDLKVNHGRSVVRAFIQNVVDVVGSIAGATEEDWMYATPDQDSTVTTVSISLDGTCVYLCQEGWREAMNRSWLKNCKERLPALLIKGTACSMIITVQ